MWFRAGCLCLSVKVVPFTSNFFYSELSLVSLSVYIQIPGFFGCCLTVPVTLNSVAVMHKPFLMWQHPTIVHLLSNVETPKGAASPVSFFHSSRAWIALSDDCY